MMMTLKKPNPVTAMWFFYFIFICYFSTGSINANQCYKHISDVDSLHFSGSLNTQGSMNCTDTCTTYHSVQRQYNVSYLLGPLCFCSENPPQNIGTPSICADAKGCISTQASCQYEGYSYNADVRSYPSLILPSTLTVGEEFSTFVVTDVTQTVTHVVYDPGDGRIVETTDTQINHTYHTSGSFLVVASISRSGSSVQMVTKHFVYVSQTNASINVSLELPTVFMVDRAYQSYVTLTSGDDVRLGVKQEYVRPDGQVVSVEEDVIDAFVLEYSLTPAISGPLTSQTGMVGAASKHFVFVPTLTFTESGRVSGFDFDAGRTGRLKVCILRPKKCTPSCSSSFSLLTSSRNRGTTNIGTNDVYTVTYVVEFDVTMTGSQVHHVQQQEVEVKEGDLLAYYESQTPLLQYGDATDAGIVYKPASTEARVGTEVTSTGAQVNPKVPFLRAHVKKATKSELFDVPKSSIGNITFTVSNIDTNEVLQQDTVSVQSVIDQVIFENVPLAFPSENQTLLVSARALPDPDDYRPDVAYNFTIQEISRSLSSDTRSVTFQQSYWSPGFYTIEVYAFNLLNTTYNETTFRVLDQIHDLRIIDQGRSDLLGRAFRQEVHVMNGTNVTLCINFGEKDYGSGEACKPIDNAHDTDGHHRFDHTYTTCGEYTVAANATNDVTETIEKTITISVACPITGLKVDSTPALDIFSNQVKLSKKDKLSLEISIDEGSFVKYLINWGDNNTESVDHRSNFSSIDVRLQHKYSFSGDYVVNVTASNILNTQIVNFTVKIQNCSEPPLVNFDYGTPDHRFSFTRGYLTELLADWTYSTEKCKRYVSPKINSLHCSFNDTLLDSRLLQESREDGYVCIIPERSMAVGEYDITFTFTYSNQPHRFIGYLDVKRSDLVATIQSGDYRTIAHMQKTSRYSPPTYYLFQLDGSKSGDPDDPNTNMTFQWFCRHVDGNRTGFSLCVTKTYEPLSVQGNGGCVEAGRNDRSIRVNTTCLSFDGKYEILLNITEQSDGVIEQRTASAKQIIEVEEGDPPHVELECVTNCQQKVNTMERFAIRFTCDTCFGRALEAVWTYKNTKTNSTVVVPGNSRMQANLVIEHEQLEESVPYLFELAVNYRGFTKQSKVQIKKLTSGRPRGGSCDVSPRKGQAAKTKFRAKCKQWTGDEDGPLTYEFRFNVGKKKAEVNHKMEDHEDNDDDASYPLLNPSSLSRPEVSNILLPAGSSSYNYSIQLIIRIMNKYGVYAEWIDTSVEVINPTLEEDDEDASQNNSTSKQSAMSKYIKNLDEAKPKNENDTQAMTAFVTSAVSVIESVKEEVIPTLEPTVAGRRFGGLLVDEEHLKLHAIEHAKQNKEKKNFKADLVGDLKKLPAKNIQQVKAITDSLSSVTSSTSEVSTKAKESAIDILLNMKDTLQTVTQNDDKVGAVYLEEATTPFVNTISNLFDVEVTSREEDDDNDEDANDAKFHTTSSTTNFNVTSEMQNTTLHDHDHYREAKREEHRREKAAQSLKNVDSLVESLSTYFSVVSKNRVAGENATGMKTKAFDFKLKKISSAHFVNVSITEHETEKGFEDEVTYGFQLPNMTSLFERENMIDVASDISLENVNFKKNIYTSDLNSSHNVKTEIATLSIKASDQALNVSNLSEPIVINIKNTPSLMKPKNVSLFLPGDVMFNKTQLTSIDCNMLLNFDYINDLNNITELIVYIQYGRSPSSEDFDVKLRITHREGMTMTVSDTAKIFNTTASETNSTTSQNNCSFIDTNLTTTRIVHAHKIDNRSIVMWDFADFYYSHCAQNLTLYFSYMYKGPLPNRYLESNPFTYDIDEYRGSFNYSVRAFCTECTYWNVAQSRWMTDGCALNPLQTSLQTTSCLCDHLTSFGGFFVAPNPLPTPTFDMLKNGFVLLIAVVTILLLYIVGLIIVRRIDIEDIKKIGVCPLLDNKPEDRYLYEITVNTGTRRDAGTTSNVFFRASGDISDSDVHHLHDPQRQAFQQSNSDVFVMATPNCIGDINYIRLWHDNSGGGWYVRSVELIDLQTEEKYLFICTRWLSVDKHDGMLDCIIPVCGKEELRDFNYLFTNKTKRELSDAHIWFSIYARPPRSSFTRCQRLSVAISMLLCAMLSSCMFFQAEPPRGTVVENRIGGFTFSLHQLFIAIMGTCITVPINLVLVGLFRIINPVPPSSKISPAPSMISMSADETMDEHLPQPESSQDKPKLKRKKAFFLPYWCLYPTWMLCIAVILSSAFLVVWYGMTFGNRKSLDWLASVTICIVQDIVLVQPLKVFAMALFIALVVKKLDEEEKSEIEKNVKTLSQNESWLHKLQDEGTIFDRVEITDPPDLTQLESMRSIRQKELRMAAISRELLFYFVFTLVVFLIGYNMRDEFAYHQTKDIKELLRLSVRPKAKLQKGEVFGKLQSYQEFWDWCDVMLLPEMYPKKWFNLSQKLENTSLYDYPGNIFLNDLTSKLVNGLRLRQMRVEPNSCPKAEEIRKFIRHDCADEYGIIAEEKRDFKYSWDIPYTSYEHKPPISFHNKPWRYQDSELLDTYRIMAKLNTYVGGGYAVELFPKFDNKAILDELKQRRWIDRHTRAVVVEFAVYNAQTNYFDMCMIVFEFPPGGGLVHYSSVATFRLSLFTKETAFFVVACFVLYLMFMVVFTIRELRVLFRVGVSYFREFWNIVEMANVVLSIVGVIFYCYLDVLRKDLMSRLPHKVPNKFINFHLASMWYDALIHIVALICFFVTLKFIKLLRFNKRISMLSSTLKEAWYPLAMFGIMFAIIIAAVVFSATIIFGHRLYGYRNWWGTTASVFSLLLGKFSYYQFESTNPVLGPIFFFTFNIMVNWIIMNMFISILNDVFACVQAEILMQQNEYEMLDYITGNIKTWLGFSDDSNTPTSVNHSPSKNSLQSDIYGDMDGASSVSLPSRKSLDRSGSNCSGASRGMSSHHWNRAEQLFVEDSSFLDEEELSDEFISETVEKFTKCIDLLCNDKPFMSKKKSEVELYNYEDI